MSDKYIIKNCPARLPKSGLCIEAPKKKAYSCQDCTDCVLKQIASLCKNNECDYSEYSKNIKCVPDDSCSHCTRYQILQLLDIQEIK